MKEKTKESGADFGWKVHDALNSWTGKVDTKASIVLAIESAVFGFVINMSTDKKPLSALTADALTLYRVGVTLVAASALLSLLVVFPQLNRWKTWRNKNATMVYFGHLRYWEPKKLAKALSAQKTYDDNLAEQLILMSKITWRKHAWLQWSIISLVLGCLLLALSNAAR